MRSKQDAITATTGPSPSGCRLAPLCIAPASNVFAEDFELRHDGIEYRIGRRSGMNRCRCVIGLGVADLLAIVVAVVHSMGHLLQSLAQPFEFSDPLALLLLGVAFLLNEHFAHFRGPISHDLKFAFQSRTLLLPLLLLLP